MGFKVEMLSNYLFKGRSDEVSRSRRLDPEQVDADALRASVQSRRVYTRVRRGVVLTLLLLTSPAALITIGVCALLIAASMGRPIFFLQDAPVEAPGRSLDKPGWSPHD